MRPDCFAIAVNNVMIIHVFQKFTDDISAATQGHYSRVQFSPQNESYCDRKSMATRTTTCTFVHECICSEPGHTFPASPTSSRAYLLSLRHSITLSLY